VTSGTQGSCRHRRRRKPAAVPHERGEAERVTLISRVKSPVPYQLGERPSLSAFACFRSMMLVPSDDASSTAYTSPVPCGLRSARPMLIRYRQYVGSVASLVWSWVAASFRSSDKAPPVGFIAGQFRDAGSRNAEGRLRFPSAAFRDVELNALNYRRFSTPRVAIGLPPRSLLKMEWTFVGRRDH